MIYILASLLAIAAPSIPQAWLTGVSVRHEAASATVTIAINGPSRYTTRYWTGKVNTLVVDVYPARLAIPPGPQYSHPNVRVRVGQFQQLTARVVIESAHTFVWSLSRTPAGLEATVQFPRLTPPSPPVTPTPLPTPSQTAHRPKPAEAPPSRPSPEPVQTFAIYAAGTLDTVAQTIAAITGTRIEVHPSVAYRPVVLKLPQATLQQALAELARQTATRWTRLPDGTVRIGP